MDTIQAMLQALQHNPQVLGIIEFGGNTATDAIETGDYDLVVIVKQRNQAVTSLHFYINGVPVDLGLLTDEELRQVTPVDAFYAPILRTGRILYDPTGMVGEQRMRLAQRQADQPAPPLSEHTIAFIRHGHRHLLDKLQGRLQTMPTLCRLLLHTNIY